VLAHLAEVTLRPSCKRVKLGNGGNLEVVEHFFRENIAGIAASLWARYLQVLLDSEQAYPTVALAIVDSDEELRLLPWELIDNQARESVAPLFFRHEAVLRT
jgi:hypothetical protein